MPLNYTNLLQNIFHFNLPISLAPFFSHTLDLILSVTHFPKLHFSPKVDARFYFHSAVGAAKIITMAENPQYMSMVVFANET